MIYLCRHGETDYNRTGRFQGRLDIDLNAVGRRQAAAMADLLADLVGRDPPGAWRIVSSPQRRAHDTALAIAARTGCAVDLDERLVEIDVGDWSGRLYAEVAREQPSVFDSREWFLASPNGEGYDAIMERVASWLADQKPEPQRRLIVVSHGVTGRLIRGLYAGLARAEMLAQDVPQDAVFRLANGQVDRLECEPLADD